MPGRPRCRCCKKTFTPNFRNRTKIDHPQLYCGEPPCRVESHRDASERYRSDRASRRREAPSASPGDSASLQASLLNVKTLARQIRRTSSRIAAVITQGEARDRCEASDPLAMGNGASTSQRSA